MFKGMFGGIGRRDIFAIAALAVAGVGIPLWLAAAAGAIGVPSNDDWVYMRAAGSLFRTGSIDMPGHTAASIGQIVMVQPLLWLSGGGLWAFTAFGLIMTLIGIVSTYFLARRFVGTGSAVMVVLLLVAFPGFGREAASFMTDVPAYALTVLCLLLGTVWLQGEGGRVTLVASIAAGILAVSIREFAFAAPAAVLVAGWARNRAGERLWLAAMSGILVAGVACVLIIADSLPGHGAPAAPAAPKLLQLIFLGPAFSTLAAVLLPAAALAIGRGMASLRSQQIILAAGLVLLFNFLPRGPLVGNIWMTNGLAGDFLLSGTRDPVIGSIAWTLSGQLALFAAIVFASLALSWGRRNLAGVSSLSTAMGPAIRIGRSRDAPILIFLVAYATELVVFVSVTGMFDRYLYPMVAVAAILLLRGSAGPSRLGRSYAFSHAAFAWLAASAFVIAANSFAYDAARYRAGEAAVAMGYDARTVDAGYEWVGYHARVVGNSGSGTYGLMWYDDTLLSDPPCAVFSNSPLDDGALRLIRVDRSAYLQYLFFGPAEPLYLYGSLAKGCPPPPPAVAAAP